LRHQRQGSAFRIFLLQFESQLLVDPRLVELVEQLIRFGVPGSYALFAVELVQLLSELRHSLLQLR